MQRTLFSFVSTSQSEKRKNDDQTGQKALVDAHELSRDFTQFKLTIRGHGAGRMSFDDTCTIVIKEYPHVFPSFSRLAALALVIPVSSVPCERGFSVQNQIKTKGRSRLSDKHVDCLMLLAMYDANVEDFDYDDAILEFVAAKGRRKF